MLQRAVSRLLVGKYAKSLGDCIPKDQLAHRLPLAPRLVHNASDRSSDYDESEGQRVRRPDPLHRTATEIVWPASSRQEKLAARVHGVLSEILMQDLQLRQALIEQFGFAIDEVRISPDNMKAFILYGSLTGQDKQTARELQRRMGKIRSAVARGLKMRHAPLLVFRNNLLTQQETQLQHVLDRLEDERADRRD